MESVFDLVISGIMLALPVIIFFAGFFIIFGELFRTVNAIYTLRFSDAFSTFAVNNEGYPFVNPSKNWSLLQLVTVKGGFAYVSYDPVKDRKLNLVVYPEPHTYQGVISGEKLDEFMKLASEFGNSYLRYRFSMGDGYDLFIASPKTGKAWGVLLPGLENNYLSSVDFMLNFPVKVEDDDAGYIGVGGSGVYSDENTVDVLSLTWQDFSSSGLLTSLNSKNDITPPSGFINAPVVFENGSSVFMPLWFTILVNEKVYHSLTAYNYFYNKPRVEVYVEALHVGEDLVVLPRDPLSVELVISLSRWIPDYKKINAVKLVITYRYGSFKLVSTEYTVSPDAEFFIIPIDWTKSVTENQLKQYEKYNDKITLYATVSYILTYGGNDYVYTAPVTVQLPLPKG